MARSAFSRRVAMQREEPKCESAHMRKLTTIPIGPRQPVLLSRLQQVLCVIGPAIARLARDAPLARASTANTQGHERWARIVLQRALRQIVFNARL
eukprot:346928-Prymnesium_polylepis.2